MNNESALKSHISKESHNVHPSKLKTLKALGINETEKFETEIILFIVIIFMHVSNYACFMKQNSHRIGRFPEPSIGGFPKNM